MVMHELRMRLIGLNRKKVILLLSLPAMFLLTVGILNGSLKSDGDPKPDRIHLVASRIHEGPSLKTRSYKLLHTSDPLDKKYDTDKLLLLGQVETKADEDTRDKGNLLHFPWKYYIGGCFFDSFLQLCPICCYACLWLIALGRKLDWIISPHFI